MVDLSENPVAQIDLIFGELEKAHLITSKPRGKVDIDRKHAGSALRIVNVGRLLDCTVKDKKCSYELPHY